MDDYGARHLFQKVLIAVEDKFFPQRHGEFRPTAEFWVGLIFVAFGAVLSVPAVTEGWPFSSWLPILGIVALGAFLFALYFRVQLHFRRAGVFIFRFGKLRGYEKYSDWSKVQLSLRFSPPIEIVRKDGTVWHPPLVGDRSGAAGEMFWRMSEAGVPIPDEIARLNRMGLKELEPYSLANRGKFPPRNQDDW